MRSAWACTVYGLFRTRARYPLERQLYCQINDGIAIKSNILERFESLADKLVWVASSDVHVTINRSVPAMCPWS